MDAYDRKARLYPAICALFPLTVLATTTFEPGTWWASVIGLGTLGGIHVLVIQLVRDRGVAAQRKLWSAWGGNPTALRLRWAADDRSSQASLHSAVRNATGADLPSQAEEEADPEASMKRYESAVATLRDRTRDQARFPLVKAELSNYGFRRNLYSLKPFGLTVAIAALALSLVLLSTAFAGHTLRWLVPSATAMGALALWLAFIRSGFVRLDAERYADALLAAADEVNRSE